MTNSNSLGLRFVLALFASTAIAGAYLTAIGYILDPGAFA